MRKKISAALGLSLNLLGKNLLLPFLLLAFSGNVWGQLGSFPNISNGFESQTMGSVTSSLSQGTPYGNWILNNSTGASATINSTGGRSGAYYINYTSTNSGTRRISSPTVQAANAGGFASSTSYVIQFYYKTNGANSFGAAINLDGTTSWGTTETTNNLSNTSGNWVKRTVVLTTNAGSSPTGISAVGSRYGHIQFRSNASMTNGIDIDDVTVYAGTAADTTAPNSPGTVTINNNATNPQTSLDLSWGAASGGVDGGGYVVVRYAVNPNADNDPNQNGIYAVGNTITNGTGSLTGTVRYIGTGTSFTDSGLTPGTTYYYKVYTVDKAFNYSAESSANHSTTSSDSTPPSLSSLNPTNSATNVLVGSNLVATFDENVAKGTGNIIIKRYSDDSVVETIDVTSSQVTVSGATVTIDPTANLASNTHYYLEIASTAIKDLANNNFAGISGNAAWNFTTEVLSPNINLSTTTLSGFNYLEGFGPSAEQMFTISGQNLTGNVILDAPANYEISKSTGTGFGASIFFTPAELATAQNVYVHLKSGLSASSSPYNSENIAISGGGITTQNVVCNGTVTANTMVDFGNLQWPSTLSVDEGDTSATVYARTYKAGVTTADGNQSQITVWIGVSPQNAAANSDPSTWTTWIPASFDSRQEDGYGNLHHYQYSTTINTASLGLTPGTYRYASRFQMGTGSFYYGGFSSGQWNGSTNTSGTLTINSNLVDGGQVTLNPISPAEGTASVATLEIYEPGLTDTPTQNTNVTIEFAYKATSDSNPNSWSGWSSAGLSFTNAGNNDKFSFTLPSNLTPGNYYVAARAKKTGSTEWQYFGKDWSTWASSAVLTVSSNVVGYANVQSPFTGTIVQGGDFNVYSKVYKSGYTEAAGANANISGWIGYSTINAGSTSDFATATWTWVPATFNVQVLNDDEYVANIGTTLSAGTYYYVSRYQVAGSTEYKYGGINNNFWGAPENSGVLTVQTPREINVKQGTTNIATGGTYNFGNQAFGTSSSAITFTVENEGQESLSVGTLSISGTNASEFAITQVDTTLPHSVSGGGNTTFTVTFSPTGAGSKTAQLSLANDDANESPYIINLTGVGGPANDNCSGAIDLTVNANPVTGDVLGATLSSGYSNVSGAYPNDDVWYKFNSPIAASYTVRVKGSAGFDAVFEIRDSCGRTAYNWYRDVNADGGEEVWTFSGLANTTYNIRVYDYENNIPATTTFTIQVTSDSVLSTNGTTSLAFGNVNKGSNSASQSFNLSGYFLTGSPAKITVNAPTNYEVSLDGANWASSVDVEDVDTDAAIAAPIYVRFNTTNACGASNGNITFTGGGIAIPPIIALTATAIVPTPTATAATDITDTSFTANWNTVAGADGYELDVYKKEDALNNNATIVGWNFDDQNVTSDEGITVNLNKNITTTASGTIEYSTTSVSGYSAHNDGGWVNGSGSKYWQVSFETTGVSNIKLSSVQRSSNTGPKNFKVQYSINGSDWFDVSGASVTLANNWTTGILNNVSLPSACENQSLVYLRWIMTSNLQVSSGNVTNAGISRIDNIKIVGDQNVTTKTYVSGYNPKTITGGSTTSDVVTGLTADTQYHYVVRAITSTCESSNSNEIDVETDNTVVWDAGAWSNTTGPGNSGTLDVIVRAPFVVGANIDQASFTAKNLTVENTGSLEIPANESITVAGNITTADNKITIDSDGSLLQTNEPSTNQNTGKIIVKRGTHMRKMDYTYWSAPVTGQRLLNTSNSAGGTNPALYNVGGFSEGTPNNRIYQYNEPNDTFKAATDTDFVPAKAYAIRGKDSYAISNPSNNPIADEFSFTGIANNGAYTVGIQKSKNTPSSDPVKPYTHGYNMIGNPYPSSIDFIKFYNLNHGDGTKNSDHILGKAWFWSNVSVAPTNQGGSGYTPNNYAILSLAGTAPATGIDNGETSGNPAPNQFIKVAQGFIVEMKGTPPTGTDPALTATLKFDNSIRENNNTGYFYNSKTVENINRYWLKLTSPFNIVNTILVAHMDNATNNYDEDYDAELLSVGDDSFYSKLNSQKLQIQARNNPLNIEDVISLGAKYSTEGTYKISLGIKEGLFSAGQQIYLLDKVTNTYTDLTTQDYTFSAVKGTDEARFEIVYKNKEVLGTDTISKSDFIVYKDADYFVIKSSQILGKVELYDASGRLVVSKNSYEKQIRIDSSALSSGVYIIKADNSGNIRTKKLLK